MKHPISPAGHWTSDHASLPCWELTSPRDWHPYTPLKQGSVHYPDAEGGWEVSTYFYLFLFENRRVRSP